MRAWLRSGAMEDSRNGSLANVELGHISFKLLSNSRGSYTLTHKGLKMARAQDGGAVGLGWEGIVGMRGATVVLGSAYIQHAYKSSTV